MKSTSTGETLMLGPLPEASPCAANRNPDSRLPATTHRTKTKKCPEARLAGGWDLDSPFAFYGYYIYKHASLALSLLLFRPVLPTFENAKKIAQRPDLLEAGTWMRRKKI